MESKFEYVKVVEEGAESEGFLVMKLDLLQQFIKDNCERIGQENVNSVWKFERMGEFTEKEIAEKYPEE